MVLYHSEKLETEEFCDLDTVSEGSISYLLYNMLLLLFYEI
jgi:hypothetical protein